MKFSDIKTGHLYFVDYKPTKDGEFGGKHLSIIIKKNNDNKSIVVVPLTSNGSGNNVNKLDLGILSNLPSSLSGRNSYAVFNQIRTVSYDRVFMIMDGSNPIQYKLDSCLLEKTFIEVLFDITYNNSHATKFEIFQHVYLKSLERFIVEEIYYLSRNDDDERFTRTKLLLKNNLINYPNLVDNIKEDNKNTNFLKILEKIVSF